MALETNTKELLRLARMKRARNVEEPAASALPPEVVLEGVVPKADSTFDSRYELWTETTRAMRAGVPHALLEEPRGTETSIQGGATENISPLAARSAGQMIDRFKNPQFLESWTTHLDATAQRSLKKVVGTLETLRTKVSKLGEDEQQRFFDEYLATQNEGMGMGGLLARKDRNPFAQAAVVLLSAEVMQKLGRITMEITDGNTGLLPATPIDINAREKAPILGLAHKYTGAAMVPDVVAGVIAASTTYSGVLKTMSAGLPAINPGVNDYLVQMLGASGVATLDKITAGTTAAAVAYKIITSLKDPMREAAHTHPDRNVILAAYQANPARFSVGVAAAMVAASMASHGVTSSTLQGEFGASFGAKFMEQLAPQFTAIQDAEKSVLQDLPHMIEIYFKAYVNVEAGGASKEFTTMLPTERAVAEKMKWKFSPPTRLGLGPITAAKMYFIDRTSGPKLTPENKAKLDEILHRLHIPDDKGFAWYAAEISKTAMQPAAERQRIASDQLKQEIEQLKSTTPVKHLLQELTVVWATTGQEIPNLLTVLTHAKSNFISTYDQFTHETWQNEVQKNFNEAMTAIGSKADTLDMKFPTLSKGNEGEIPLSMPHVSAIPFLYSDEEWRILSKVTGIKFESSESRAAWNAVVALLYGITDTATVYPSIRLSKKREEYFGEVEEERERELDERENALAQKLTDYLNGVVHPAIRMLANVDLPIVSVESMRVMMSELATEDKPILQEEKEQGPLVRTRLYFRRLIQMHVPESVEKQVARAEWYNEQLKGIEDNPEHLMTLIGRMYKPFQEFRTMAERIQKNPREVERLGPAFMARMRTDADSLAKAMFKQERTVEARKVAMLDTVLAHLQSTQDISKLTRQPELSHTEQRLERGVAIAFDGTSAIEVNSAEATYFFATAELERAREHALTKLGDLMSHDVLFEARAWGQDVLGGRRVVVTPSQADIRSRIDAARRELGADVNQIVEEFERTTYSRMLGLQSNEQVDTTAVSRQLTAINRDAVGTIRNMMADTDPARNALRQATNHEVAITYGMDEGYERPMLQIHMFDPVKQESIASVTYPAPIPNLHLDNDKLLTDHIVEWYRLVGQYELAVKTIKLDTATRWEKVAENIRATRPDLKLDITAESDAPTLAELGLITQYHVLGEMAAREEQELRVLRSGKPIRPEQLAMFDSSQIVIMSRSGVPETPERLARIISDIQEALRSLATDTPSVRYDISTAEFSVAGPSGEKLISLREVTRGRDILTVS